MHLFLLFQYDFWQYPGAVNKSVDIHVKLQDYKNFTSLLHANGMKYEYLMYDLQAKMDHQNDQPTKVSDKASSWYTKYHPFDEVGLIIACTMRALDQDRERFVLF